MEDSGADGGGGSVRPTAQNVSSFERSSETDAVAASPIPLGRVAIVGAGQIGTMLGLALMAAPPTAGVRSVALHDVDPSVARESLRLGAGVAVVDSADEAFRADTLVLSVPVDQIVNLLDEFGARVAPGSLVIDTGGAKRAVVHAMRRCLPRSTHAVGGHPMAGTERAGPTGADVGRLAGAAFVLTPVRDDPNALAHARAFVRAVGARPLVMGADEHDRTVAFTSHLPHLIASALAQTVPATGDSASTAALAATGFLGATRLAESDPSATSAFLCANAESVAAAAAQFEAALGGLVDALRDRERLLAALTDGRDRRRAIAGGRGDRA